MFAGWFPRQFAVNRWVFRGRDALPDVEVVLLIKIGDACHRKLTSPTWGVVRQATPRPLPTHSYHCKRRPQVRGLTDFNNEKGESMSFSQFVRAASDKLGQKIPKHVARHAIIAGGIKSPTKTPDGWFVYSESNVSELVEFVRSRSRRLRRGISVAS